MIVSGCYASGFQVLRTPKLCEPHFEILRSVGVRQVGLRLRLSCVRLVRHVVMRQVGMRQVDMRQVDMRQVVMRQGMRQVVMRWFVSFSEPPCASRIPQDSNPWDYFAKNT